MKKAITLTLLFLGCIAGFSSSEEILKTTPELRGPYL